MVTTIKNTKQAILVVLTLGLSIAAQTLFAQSCPVDERPSLDTTYPWPVWTPAIPIVQPSTTGNTYYVDGTAGVDTNTGKSLAAAFKTIGKALSALAVGDTILIRKGLYREPINLLAKGVPSGTAAKPITIGSYGDGEVIVDGSAKTGTWTLTSGTVWKAPVSFAPIGVVVNNVPLKQVTQGQNGSTAPQVGLAGVTSGSGKWHIGSGVITADFGNMIGAGNPNQADVVVPNNIGDQAHVFFYGHSYIRFVGLTIRGSGSNGIWGYGSNNIVESCNIKFNGKAAVLFLANAEIPATDNAVIMSHIYHNVLSNWPRGNNFNAEAGGGWPGSLGWSGNLRPVARGNIVYMNGGEGIISYGSFYGQPSGSALFEQNIAYDNWSVNMYFDNQPNNVARNNLIFNHPINFDPASSNFLYVGSQYPYNQLGKYSVCVMLADEQNSSDGANNYAGLDGTRVYNNIIAGCRIGIRDYGEGAITLQHHALKNTLIANNTIIMPATPIPNAATFGIFLTDNAGRNINTTIANNIIYGYGNDSVIYSESNGALTGINLNNNLYYSTSATPFGSGFNTVKLYNFVGWKANATGSDTKSLFADPEFVYLNHFRIPGISPYLYSNADLLSTSPARNAGAAQSFTPAVNYRLENRSVWNIGSF